MLVILNFRGTSSFLAAARPCACASALFDFPCARFLLVPPHSTGGAGLSFEQTPAVGTTCWSTTSCTYINSSRPPFRCTNHLHDRPTPIGLSLPVRSAAPRRRLPARPIVSLVQALAVNLRSHAPSRPLVITAVHQLVQLLTPTTTTTFRHELRRTPHDGHRLHAEAQVLVSFAVHVAPAFDQVRQRRSLEPNDRHDAEHAVHHERAVRYGLDALHVVGRAHVVVAVHARAQQGRRH
ncbi:hypothetical protein AMAG_02710 [Allomyces macrogynus ATCC 38327]|uniref:Uncharacterized protein n=1 Tax=Allomyces macrogynus (strain ATCC 38327) TaxID=578462 RepID=A0A0L0S3H6_ALLM3|nr:hypothetical protein AMAG_02710 [Allomyces macrogynus ATCC 38327]|eukprot:KNE56944.1 hypothetical protein AMAG_02710 [Allomyces macrogynus ATCC 38327]